MNAQTENRHPVLKLSRPDLTEALYLMIDPNQQFQDIETNRLLAAMGILPSWAASKVTGDFKTFKQALAANYPFGGVDMVGGEIASDGAYSYPEDPTLHPLASITHGGETVYFYEYSMVGTRNNETGEQWLTRMD